jgi:hypothetical protein
VIALSIAIISLAEAVRHWAERRIEAAPSAPALAG